MLISWYRAKKAEFEIKAVVYGTIAGIMRNHKDIITIIQKGFIALKDTTPEEFKSTLIKELAELVHQSNQKTDKENLR